METEVVSHQFERVRAAAGEEDGVILGRRVEVLQNPTAITRSRQAILHLQQNLHNKGTSIHVSVQTRSWFAPQARTGPVSQRWCTSPVAYNTLVLCGYSALYPRVYPLVPGGHHILLQTLFTTQPCSTQIVNQVLEKSLVSWFIYQTSTSF